MGSYKIYLPTTEGNKLVNCKDIIYAEQQNMFSRIFLTDNIHKDVLLTVTELTSLLKKHVFFRFNYRNLVNLSYVQVVFPLNASKVILENGKEIFVSEDKKEELFENLKNVFELHEKA